VIVLATLAFVAFLAVAALSRTLVDHEPPQRRRRRAQLRALKDLEPVTRVWPEPADPRRGHP